MLILFEAVQANELQFLFYLIPVIIGTQLGLYFFYQYFKIQDVNLRLNRIMLSFGAFTLLIVFGALFINVQRLFGGTSTDIFYRFGWVFALSSPTGFLAFITLDEFSPIMNLKFVKIVMVLSFIPLFMVSIFGVSPIFLGTLPFSVLSAYYILGFQIRLIRRTMGDINRRFKLFFTGELISLFSLPFAVVTGIGVFESPITELVYYSGVGLLITGFIIIFVSAYNFPPFYEFEWKENLLKLFVINQTNNKVLYFTDLEKLIAEQKKQEIKEPQYSMADRMLLYSGGIAGIETVIGRITDTKHEKISKIKQEDSYILLDYGTDLPITYAMFVRKDLVSLQHLLKSVKFHFERLFREVLLKLDSSQEGQNQIFTSFDTIINIVLER